MTLFVRILFLGLLSVLFVGCEDTKTLDDSAKKEIIERMATSYRQSYSSVPEVSPDELANLEDVVIVDARSADERAISIIPHSISKAEFEATISTLREKKVVVYCTIGYRSGLYAKSCRADGIDAYNLRGSILSWLHSGHPIVLPNADATPTTRLHVYGKKWDLAPAHITTTW